MNLTIKQYTYLAIFLFVAGLFGYSNYKSYNFGKNVVQLEFERYKNEISLQVQQAKNEKIRIEAIQNERYNMAQTGYASALDILNERLRTIKALPRDCTVPMAGNSPGTVPGETTDTGDAQIKLETFKGTCSREFYEAALRDTLQCESLIAICK